MQRRLIIVLILLAALAQLAILFYLLFGEDERPALPVIEAPPQLLPPDPVDDLRATPEKGTLRGKVIDGINGAPIRGAKVIALAPHLVTDTDDAVPYWGDMIERKSVVTDEKGTFSLEELPPDYWNLWVERRGFAWASVPRVKFAEEHVVRLYPECSVRGRVVYPDGTPASNIHVEYTPQGSESEVFGRYKLKTFYIRTREDGTFEYRGLIPGPFTIEIYPEDHLPAPWAMEPPLTPAENRDLGTHKLDTGFTMSVKVLWRGTNEPVPGIEVAVRPAVDPMPRTKTGRRAFTDSNGIARFGGLGGQVVDKPTFSITANVPGVGPVRPDEPGFSAPDSMVTIYLRKGGIVKGKVIRPNGEILERFFVELKPKGFQTHQISLFAEDGEFTIYQVPEGGYTLAVRYGNLVDQESEIVVEGGKELDVGTIQLASGAEIYGTVRFEGGRRIEEGEVVRVHLARKVMDAVLKREDYASVARAICKPDGAYRLQGLPAGEYWIWPEPDRVTGTTPPLPVRLSPGMGGLAMDLIVRGAGHLRFTFVDEIEGQRRQVVPPPVFLLHQVSQEETRWWSDGTPLAPGVYDLFVELKNADGVPHRYKGSPVTVQDGETSNPIEVRLFEIRDDS